MKNSLLNNLFILVIISSCVPRYSRYIKSNPIQENCRKITSIVEKPDSVVMFNTNVETYGKHLSGILVLKNINNDSLKATFVSAFGLKFFDFEYTKDSVSVKSVIPQLNNAKVLKVLQDDIRQVSRWGFKFESFNFKEKPENCNLIQSRIDPDYIYFELDSTERIIKSCRTLGNSRKLKNKTEYVYTENSNSVSHIYLKHYKYKLNISLDILKNHQ